MFRSRDFWVDKIYMTLTIFCRQEGYSLGLRGYMLNLEGMNM